MAPDDGTSADDRPGPLPDLDRAQGAELYGGDTAAYERGRPAYPEQVFDVLRERCGARPGARVLEIGPGTGLATGQLLDAGCTVTAVEPDPGMAAVLAARFAGAALEVVPGRLEDADLPDAGFDVAAAATSFHWVDQRVGPRVLRRVLRPGGWCATWWTLFEDPWALDTFGGAVERTFVTALYTARNPLLSGGPGSR